jgi:hypothetical protein
MRYMSLAVFAFAAGCTGSEATQPSPSGPVPVASVTIEGPASMRVPDSAGLQVVLLDIAGRRLSHRPVSFASSDPGIASIDTSGIVRTLTEGLVTITARSESASGTMTLRVLPRLPCSYQPLDCLTNTERYVLVSVNGQPLPVKSPWGIGEWDYDADAGTWMLTDAAITLFPGGAYTYAMTHRAASGVTISDNSVGLYVRGPDSIEFSVAGGKWSASISATTLIERWPDGRTFTFER